MTTTPDKNSDGNNVEAPKIRPKKVCHFYANGTCRLGDRCKFFHQTTVLAQGNNITDNPPKQNSHKHSHKQRIGDYKHDSSTPQAPTGPSLEYNRPFYSPCSSIGQCLPQSEPNGPQSCLLAPQLEHSGISRPQREKFHHPRGRGGRPFKRQIIRGSDPRKFPAKKNEEASQMYVFGDGETAEDEDERGQEGRRKNESVKNGPPQFFEGYRHPLSGTRSRGRRSLPLRDEERLVNPLSNATKRIDENYSDGCLRTKGGVYQQRREKNQKFDNNESRPSLPSGKQENLLDEKDEISFNKSPSITSRIPAELFCEIQRIGLLFPVDFETSFFSDEMLDDGTVRIDTSFIEEEGVTSSLMGTTDSLCSVFVSIFPSDPDFDKSTIPNGIRVQLLFNGLETVEASSIEKQHNDKREEGGEEVIPQFGVKSRLIVKSMDIPKFVRDNLPVVFDRSVSLIKKEGDPRKRKHLTYEALKLVDRHIPQIYEIGAKLNPEEFQLYSKSRIHVLKPWTSQAQAKLEEAMVWYKGVKDPKLKWLKIAQLVGEGRTAKECAERFKVCREILLNKASAAPFHSDHPSVTDSVDVAPIGSGDEEKISESDQSFVSDTEEPSGTDCVTEQRRKDRTDESGRMEGSEDIDLIGLNCQNIHLFQIGVFRFVVRCSRCSSQIPATISPFREVADSIIPCQGSTGLTCPGCSTKITTSVSIPISFPNQSRVGSCVVVGGVVGEVLPSSYLVECSSCNSEMLCRDVYTGTIRSINCRTCHLELSFQYDSVAIGGKSATAPAVIGDLSRHYRPKKVKESFVLKLGTPLPENGTCKHYKKSFRWLRFPCCGRAFPCDVCHDEQSDHPHDWANRMLCGRCSKEQPYSQKPCVCGSSLTGGFSSHWEGGKGCRDPMKMSRKDEKKYKLISKAKTSK